MKNEKISVVIPTYGRPKKLIKNISILINNQDIDVIIVDDNGKGTKEQLYTEGLINKHCQDKVKYLILESNCGAALARNEGVKIAESNYITFIDDDDELLCEETLDKFNFMKENECDVLCSNMFIKKNDEFINLKKNIFIGSSLKDFLLYGNCWTPMIMIKKEVFIDVDGFDDIPYYQDHCFILKLFKHGFNVSHFNAKTFVHNEHSELRISNSRKSSAGFHHRSNLERQLLPRVSLGYLERKNFLFNNARLDFFGFCIDNENKYERCKLIFNNVRNIYSTRSFLLICKDFFYKAFL